MSHVPLEIGIFGYYSARVDALPSLFSRYNFTNCVLGALEASFSILGSVHLSLREHRRPWQGAPELFEANVSPEPSNSYYEI